MDKLSLQKINRILIFIFAVTAASYIGATFLIPLISGFFLATLVLPVCNKLEKIGMGRLSASLLTTFLVFVAVVGIGWLLSFQVRQLIDDLPQMQKELENFLRQLQDLIFSQTGFSPEQQRQFILNRSDQIMSQIEDVFQVVLGDFFTTAGHFLLMLVYLFLFLQKRHKYENFLLMYVPEEKKERGREVIGKTTNVAHQYLWGRIQVMTLLGIMYLITFYAFGLRHAGLLTLFGAIITVIPYVGPFVSGTLPVFLYLISEDNMLVVLLFAFVVLIIQLIESYVLEPVVMGSEVNLAPVTIIIAIIIGNMLWGIPGMILFVPIFAIAKIISDQLKPLQPVGYLIGNSEGGSGGFLKNKFSALFSKLSKQQKK